MNHKLSTLLKPLGLLLPLALLAAACGPEDQVCGAGTRLEDGRCLPVCAPGAEIDPTTGLCSASCAEGTHPDGTGACIADSAACVTGQVWAPETGACLDVEGLCAEGSTWVSGKATCVADELLRTADFQESFSENDPNYGGSQAFEVFELPAMGETVTVSGRIDAPQDRNGDNTLEADWDAWLFEADGPTLLRVHADGLGGATAGYQVLGLWEGSTFNRIGIGTTGDAVVRDLYLPTEGLYALLATDGLHFVSRPNGPFLGGGDLGYYFEIEQLPFPEPTPLAFSGTEVLVEGEWANEAPETGSMIGFYTLPVEARHAYDFLLVELGGTVSPELFVFGREHRFSLRSADGGTMGWEGDDQLLLVADHSVFFSYKPAEPYLLQVYDREITWVDEALASTSFRQPEWVIHDGALPGKLFGLSAAQEDVLTVRASASTGRTCLTLWDVGYVTPLDEWNCVAEPERPVEPQGELRIVAPYSGFYGLASADWAGVDLDAHSGTAVHIPAHDYQLALEVHRQSPGDLGEVSAPFAQLDAVPAAAAERYFYLAAPEAGGAVAGVVTAEFPVSVQFYKPFVGQVTEAGEPRSARFAWRSVEGLPAFFGVENLLGEEGAFELDLAPLTLETAGTVSAGQALTVELELPAGSHGRTWQLAVPGAGAVELVAEASDFGVGLYPLDLALAPSGAPGWLGPMPGEPLRRAVNDEGLFFAIEPMGGPASAAITVTLQATLVPAADEAPSGAPEDAQPLALPSVIAGSAADGDADWYEVTVDAPKVLTLATLPNGGEPGGDTVLLLVDANGQTVAYDDDGGVATYSRLEHEVEAGTWYVVVVGLQSDERGYVLEVDAHDPPGGGIGVGE